jgi:hypothetical protein
MAWYYKAAALGNGNAENQLGWMYQFGRGVEQSDAEAVAWYRLSADQGSTDGKNNLRDFCVDLEQRGDELCDSGNSSVNDPALEMVQRRTRIRDLRAQISGLETDALQDDISAEELANMGKNGKAKKNNSITKGITRVFDAAGTVLAVSPRIDAANCRTQAAGLREELAELESLDQSSANVPAP